MEDIRSRLPELAVQRRKRLEEQYGLPGYDSGLLTNSKALADYFEAAVGSKDLAGDALEKFAKTASNWILGDLSRLLNLNRQDISETRVSPAHLVQLVDLIDRGIIGTTIAKTVVEEAFASGDMPEQIVRNKGYSQIDDASVVESAVAQAIEANPKAVDDYLQGQGHRCPLPDGSSYENHWRPSKARPGQPADSRGARCPENFSI